MTVPENQAQDTQQSENKVDNKEYNFRLAEARFQRELEKERQARLEAERMAQELQERQQQRYQNDDDDENDGDPYVNKKKFNKQMQKFGENTRKQYQEDINKAVVNALREKEKQDWIKANPDFYQVLQHADKFADYDPELAETILDMPEGFQRQKLVYKNIKALGLHQDRKTSIQDTVNAKQKGPHYMPSGTGTHPYGGPIADYSKDGQKQAYEKMQALLNKKRYG